MQSQLPFFGVVRVSGEERAVFLHNQLSNHIEGLSENQACYATYNTPKGRVIANMLVINRGEDILLLMSADLAEKTVKRLRMFVLRAKVVFETLPDFAVAAELADNAAPRPATEPQLAFNAATENGISRISLPHGGVMLVGKADSLPAYDAAAENAWNLHEIQSGYSWISAATTETCVAQMLNQHIIGGVHFKKGCYPGQEIIARAQYRGQVKRGLAVLAADVQEATGTGVLLEGEDAGIIINTAQTGQGSLNLAVIKHGAAGKSLADANGNTLQQTHLFFETEAN
ncbi:CAF17-like 4Fe-4S cluster assembly/insertion protein YgfZ [Neisseria wadsworthii]|uniref:CAF17-like 4Fe-4S cluster assembly/insertion protein YgfZ n=1 Tax=Neisseria wadsworthii TaxID=607711 RepID=UPI000D301885|nr:folate-binding protein YgfZ [Neisseria wadsworthii]